MKKEHSKAICVCLTFIVILLLSISTGSASIARYDITINDACYECFGFEMATPSSFYLGYFTADINPAGQYTIEEDDIIDYGFSIPLTMSSWETYTPGNSFIWEFQLYIEDRMFIDPAPMANQFCLDLHPTATDGINVFWQDPSAIRILNQYEHSDHDLGCGWEGTMTYQVVPLPPAILLLGSGLLSLIGLNYKRRR